MFCTIEENTDRTLTSDSILYIVNLKADKERK